MDADHNLKECRYVGYSCVDFYFLCFFLINTTLAFCNPHRQQLDPGISLNESITDHHTPLKSYYNNMFDAVLMHSFYEHHPPPSPLPITTARSKLPFLLARVLMPTRVPSL